MQIFSNNKVFTEFQFEREADFEQEIVQNHKLFFGPNSIYVNAKRKIESRHIGNSIPDGFLFDLSDVQNPEFYIVEVELARHDFYNHIFPQITKFFAFYRNHKNQAELVEKIFSFINNDLEIRQEFKSFLGEREIYKFLKDTIDVSQNILLVIDAEKNELPEIIETYTETWGRMVKLLLVKKFINGGEYLYSMHPEFESIEYASIVDEPTRGSEEVEYTEVQHLEGVSLDIKQVYDQIKQTALSCSPGIYVNPTKWYLSFRKQRNMFFIKLANKKLTLIVPKSLENIQEEIHYHQTKGLTPNVQKFWFGNSPASSIIIDKSEQLEEIDLLLKNIIARYS